ncbi:helix-turn-helix transcriptional regulator [Sphingobacterium sp. HJSM2_6]|uniref:AraC family transcriptional regulator n=1 Tax=Sphingobacterium sp. HJSM2_6 TaxID=3366264 RepID=UPI003BC62854
MIFTYHTGFESLTFLEKLAQTLECPLHNQEIILQENIGFGRIKGYKFASSYKVLSLQVNPKEPFIIRRIADPLQEHNISFSFFEVPTNSENNTLTRHELRRLSYVKITTANIDYEVLFKNAVSQRMLVITINPKELSLLLSEIDQEILLPQNKTYYYEEDLNPAMQQVLQEIFENNVPKELGNLYVDMKGKELLFLVFQGLIKRDQLKTYAIHPKDIKSIYQVKERILEDLSVQPSLLSLSELAQMSETKLKRLFKQIFGFSIYDYYLKMRITEAAHLIAVEGLSVSEAGYRMGFLNLSHFSRLFDRYMGIKPKKYALKTGNHVKHVS